LGGTKYDIRTHLSMVFTYTPYYALHAHLGNLKHLIKKINPFFFKINRNFNKLLNKLGGTKYGGCIFLNTLGICIQFNILMLI
jgi:hypothetical protein